MHSASADRALEDSLDVAAFLSGAENRNWRKMAEGVGMAATTSAASETREHTGLRQRHFIDASKAANSVVVLGLMALYGAWDNTAAWVYLALHGTYGALWVLKSRTFGDRQWEQPTSLAYGLVIFGGLALYWVGPWLLVSGRSSPPGPWWFAICIATYALGVFFHFASDMQKHVSLALRPGVLITDGLWARLRNPNYFGELLIYLGFTMVVFHWAPVLVLGLFVSFVWIPNMVRKDRSLSRYDEYAAYAARSKRFLPLIW